MKEQIMKFVRDEEGLTMVEYAVAGGLITAGAVAAFTLLGEEVSGMIDYIAGVVAAANPGGA